MMPCCRDLYSSLRDLRRKSAPSRDRTFDLFDLRVNHDKAWTFLNVFEKISARFVGNLPPDPLHRFRFVQVDFCPSGQIDNETQVVIGKNPVNGRVLLDLGDFSTSGEVKVYKLGKSSNDMVAIHRA